MHHLACLFYYEIYREFNYKNIRVIKCAKHITTRWFPTVGVSRTVFECGSHVYRSVIMVTRKANC